MENNGIKYTHDNNYVFDIIFFNILSGKNNSNNYTFQNNIKKNKIVFTFVEG